MHHALPSTPQDLLAWPWSEIEPHYRDLFDRPLNAQNVEEWLTDWTRLSEKLEEMYTRLSIATTVNTADKQAEARLKDFLDAIFPNAMAADQKLKEKLLASGLEPAGFAIPLRNMRAEADLFRETNLPLLAEQQKLSLEYDKIFGAQTAPWEGEEITLTQLALHFRHPDRSYRERAWHLKAERQLADRRAINDLWQRFMDVRAKIAANAGKPDYRAYAWQQRLRFDYTPEDCKAFAETIERVFVPAAQRVYERWRQALGLDRLRPWDLIDGWYGHPTPPPHLPPLRPFQSIQELIQRASAVFHQVDPILGGYFATMVAEKLTDLENRKNKAPGAYCASLASLRKPFVFVNAVGTHEDVMTTLHESGHAFHVFETAHLPYIHQLIVPVEFAEVASMGMELLASLYLAEFYRPADSARARLEHLEGMLLFWPFMAVVDSFQHWVYENPQEGADPAACDRKWSELWDRFIPAVDWSGLEEVKATGWHRKLHIHQFPFYYVEYGLAQLGAVQVFGNALRDPRGAATAYRHALALGGTMPLPKLFATAGARFAFDATTLQQAVNLMERTINELEEDAGKTV